MGDQIHLNLFEMNTLSHNSHGMWVHPDNNRHRFNDLEYWLELAQILEEGTFDALFLADVLGVYDGYRQGPETALREGMQVPANDPLMVIPAMATVAKHLGFAATFSTTYEPPFAFARRMSTLDHLTKGRVAWNIVTSYLPNAARNFGLVDEVDHDSRYDIADEYADVCYKLWEGSWDDDAVVVDRAQRIYSDPAKVRYIDHVGENYVVKGPHLSEPSPQRTPVLFQAGSSPRGREFAATHAEAVFIGGGETARTTIADIRARAEAHGRDPAGIRFIAGARVVVGRTNEEVAEKLATYDRHRSIEALLAHRGAGLDLAAYERATTIGELIAMKEPGYQRFLRGHDEHSTTTVGELLDQMTGAQSDRGGFSVAGTPEVVADAMERWVDDGGVDGFNLGQQISPGTARDFVELVVPILRRRGRLRERYADGETLRERFFGPGHARLPGDHPGARYRDPANLYLPAVAHEPTAAGVRGA